MRTCLISIHANQINFKEVLQTLNSKADVNGDGKIGLEEVIYILQKVSGLR